MSPELDDEDWSPPDGFDEYQIVRRLGRGGMGGVYLAYDTLLDRHVAVKFITALNPGARARARFITEARAAARLQHPNVLTVHRVGELDGRPFIVSEFVHGQSLDRIEKPIPWTRALELSIGLARGLAAAHRRGVLHRDIKPANAIIADDGEVKLLDFGIAKLVEGRADASGYTSSAPPSGGLFSSRPPADWTPTGDPSSRSAEDASAAVGPRPFSPRTPISAGPPSMTPTSSLAGRQLSEALVDLARGEEGDLTRRGSVLGTPRYLAPEIWRGEVATRRSDVYSLGAVLYELCTGKPPHRDVWVKELPYVVPKVRAPLLRDVEPSVDRAFAAIVDRCLGLEPAERYPSGDDLRAALEQLTGDRGSFAIEAKEGNPYRGLMAFEAEHRSLFFGRSREVQTIVERLRSEPFVLVAGDSGVGKSSLCRAGVIPAIAEGALGGGYVWSAVSLVPGRHPLGALAAALVKGEHAEVDGLVTKIREEPGELGRELRRRAEGAAGLVIFVDQLEELVTLSDPAEVGPVCDALARLASGVPGVRLLATVRGDFLTRVAALPAVGDEVARALFLLRPLTPEGIRDAVVGPARARGVAFESEALVEELVASTARAEWSLPLLQFALAELWAAREGGKGDLTAKALEAIGGVTGALTRHADHVMMTLLPRQRGVAKRVLTELVTVEGTRARRTAGELGAETAVVREALDALVHARLVVARDAETGTIYEVTHEALIRDWGALRGWLEEQAESRATRGRLSVAAAEWARLGRTREALWSVRQLAEVELLDAVTLTEHERAFVAASRGAVRRARLRIAGVPLLLLLAGGAAYGANLIHAHRELGAQVAAHVHDAERALGEARAMNERVEALRGEALRAFDARKNDAGERAWADALALAPKADGKYGGATQAFESALTLDGGRRELGRALADVLYERAVLAERDRRLDARDELLRRLGVHDEGGEHARRWSAPGRVRIATTPAGARVTLQAYTTDEQKRRVLGPARDLGVTPLDERAIDPGSYLLVFTAEGRVPVRLPLLVSRDERVALEVPLPASAEVPEGFVYVPKGWFLCGSADEGLRRGFFTTVPLHRMETGAFLIARHETTLGEWIEFLKALPKEEREKRSPRVVTSGIANGGVSLEEQRDGAWQLVLQPAAQKYVAGIGEPIHYLKRNHNATQTWTRFPVMGISSEDAAAYASWLDRSGRVPGARLCLETEWERGARGADDRDFPHGDQLEPDDENFDMTYGKEPLGFGPDEVGSHPAATSPFGLTDISGNVFEWTQGALGDARVVVRGGSYMFATPTSRIPNRGLVDASFRDLTLGMRVCANIQPTALR